MKALKYVIRKEKVGMDNGIDRLADLLATLIEKYVDELKLDSLPNPPRPTDE